ncbi:Fatty acid hydroxylase superfamily protein [Roseovarius litorisediminis]|uniref:Fatty acid hydroxylase superfamily protein n=1 Tax=Roseovarius litorisediminis TaxID=1312363 RepID=A0A1Y5TAJ2_9RHOB|nr:sterol desaturase family protein [Roseovarius litorisediminis]SLN57667.1 Fatty acid hydroxylase superfamily protein [Roseovarius litorisediminis]
MSDNTGNQSREWNYHPDLPLADPSIFKWPPNPGFVARWFVRNWLTLSERVMLVILAVLSWWLLYPSLEAAQTFAFGWIFQTWAVNMGLMVVIAGGLHWYFYMRRGQGKTLKFDKRDQAKGNRLWNFSNQVHDNVFWSLGSGVAQLTAFQVVTMWLMANGFAPVISFSSNPVWFVLALVLIPIWSAFHFYWVHRLLHVPVLYKHVHSLHHRNVNIGPWSGFSMHPVEHLIYLTTLCIHWVVASHPIHLIFHVLYQGPGAAMTHTGYEDLLIRDKRRLALGTFYHQLHHRYYECNYGNQEMPWDRWFGTFHDGSDEGTSETRARKKRMYS